MKLNTRLTLSRETLRILDDARVQDAVGGRRVILFTRPLCNYTSPLVCKLEPEPEPW